MATEAREMVAEDNVVFIGGKPPMNYVLAVVTQFKMGSGEVVLKARGKAISRCVDVAEIVRNKFMTGLTVREVRIATERVVNEDGRPTNVSAIEIALAQTAKPASH